MKPYRLSIKTLLTVAGLTALLLLPFAGKAFHIDDSLFLWCAEQIQSQPLDFYGFTANWNGVDRPMYLINQNPPLVSYYIALVSSFFGWSEIVLHVAFLIPAICLSVGVYLLALLFNPLASLAALIVAVTPAFIVSATNVMTDILMVAFYVWAAVFWLYGVERDKTSYFFFAALLISLSALTKYFGISMVPLLMVYSILSQRRFDWRILFLGIPIIVMIGYQLLTYFLYDASLISNAASYALDRGIADSPNKIIAKTLIGLSFSGGCLTVILFYSHLLWSRVSLIVGTMLVTSLASVFVMSDSFSAKPLIDIYNDQAMVIAQFFLFVLIGSQIMILAVADVIKNKDAKSFFLLLWVLGTFIFSSHVNWTINARTILPLIPAVGIMVTRRLYDRYDFSKFVNIRRVLWPLIPGAFIALLVAFSDASFANCQRSIAYSINSDFNNYRYNVWFQGHWGFQYYMQLYGSKSLDFKSSLIGKGDIIIIPKTNTGQIKLPLDQFTFVKKMECDPVKWISTISNDQRAGFYSDTAGKLILPYAFGAIDPEEYYVFIVGKFVDPKKYIRELNGVI